LSYKNNWNLGAARVFSLPFQRSRRTNSCLSRYQTYKHFLFLHVPAKNVSSDSICYEKQQLQSTSAKVKKIIQIVVMASLILTRITTNTTIFMRFLVLRLDPNVWCGISPRAGCLIKQAAISFNTTKWEEKWRKHFFV